MTTNAKSKFETVEQLRKANPTWSIKKACAKAKFSIPSYYETRKELEGLKVSFATPAVTHRRILPLWKQVLDSNLATEAKMEIFKRL